MLTRQCIEALLVDEEAADAIGEVRDKGKLTNFVAGWAWRGITLAG